MALTKQRHNNADFFIADVFDGTPLKNDIASMESPFFTLSKKPDLRTIEYRNGNVEIDINPHFKLGLPTIFDKDLLLYCCSILMSEVNLGRTPPQTFYISSHDFFIATNRMTNGQSYELFKKALDRLAGCYIKTNVMTNKTLMVDGFSLLKYSFIDSLKVKNRSIKVKISLCDWFYNSIVGREILSMNRDYFRLGKPLERRLYEIARKHCGNQKAWSIALEKLFEKSGSRDRLAKFKAALKVIIEDNDIPDYRYSLDAKDKVTVFRTNTIEDDAQARPELNLHDRAFNVMSQLRKDTRSKAKKLHEESCTDWNMQEIAVQFVQHMEKKGTPETLDGAFLGFLKKKIKTYKKDTVVC